MAGVNIDGVLALSSLTEERVKQLKLPTLEEFRAAYCRRTGRKNIPNYYFYVAFSFFRMAAIAQGVYKRALQGNASSQFGDQMGPLVSMLSDLAWSIVTKVS